MWGQISNEAIGWRRIDGNNQRLISIAVNLFETYLKGFVVKCKNYFLKLKWGQSHTSVSAIMKNKINK